jgi:alkylated DNA repair dioxygenase AlkB
MSSNSTITVTWSKCVENHAGNQQIGDKNAQGADYDEVKRLAEKFDGDFIDLRDIVDDEKIKADLPKAAIAIWRKGCNNILNVETNSLRDELLQCSWDKHCLMYGRVVNKHARHNLCFADFSQDHDYESGKGTVYSFDELPFLNKCRDSLSQFGENYENLFAEGNYYYDSSKTYIGWHGDGERWLVLGLRIGASFPLHFRWYHKNKPTEFQVSYDLNDGDMYLMCVKASGNDWKKRSVEWHLRHSAGDLKNFDKKK